jgi:hypothetical protein
VQPAIAKDNSRFPSRSGLLSFILALPLTLLAMSDFEPTIGDIMRGETLADTEMVEEVIQVEAAANATKNGGNGIALQDDEEEVVIPTRVTFVDHLRSPIVELLIGEGEAQVLLTAHQALLVQSPFFEDACSQFSDNALVRDTHF